MENWAASGMPAQFARKSRLRAAYRSKTLYLAQYAVLRRRQCSKSRSSTIIRGLLTGAQLPTRWGRTRDRLLALAGQNVLPTHSSHHELADIQAIPIGKVAPESLDAALVQEMQRSASHAQDADAPAEGEQAGS